MVGLTFVGSILTMTKSFMTPMCMKIVGYTAAGCACTVMVHSTIKFIHDDLADEPTEEEREDAVEE